MQNTRTIFLLLLIYLLSGNRVVSQINTRDSLELIDLYDSTNGVGWNQNNNWKTTAPVRTWYGISVTNNRVTRIQMLGNHMSGHFPASFGNLDSLNSLSMIDDGIGGVIPASFGNLTALTALDVGGNILTGELPSSFGNLINLVVLDIYGNQFIGEIPASFKNLKKLVCIDMIANQFSGNIFENLGHLEFSCLSVYNNQFTFSGMEEMADHFKNSPYKESFEYSPQANIPVIQTNNQLAVSAGGHVNNNSYNWYKEGEGLIATIVGDSVYKPVTPGNYYVEVTNSIATALTLKSNTVKARAVTIYLCPPIASVDLFSDITGTSYQWQQSSDGVNFVNLANGANYSGTSAMSLTLINIPSSWYGYQYRCITNNGTSTVSGIAFSDKLITGAGAAWEEPANWSCGKLPDEYTDVIIAGGVFILNSDVTIRSLELSSQASLQVTTGHVLTIKEH
ncbi:MAG: hypothetical protein ABIQ31_20775 [Ferruginibacter sp.]